MPASPLLTYTGPRLSLRTFLVSQDTPGLVYGQTNIGIPDHVTAQNAAYLTLEQDPGRRIPMSAVKDPRVDACLFFINPNHLKDAEVAAMAHLAELVPIVPVIAKVTTRRISISPPSPGHSDCLWFVTFTN